MGKRPEGGLARIPAALLRDERRHREKRASALTRRYGSGWRDPRIIRRSRAIRGEPCRGARESAFWKGPDVNLANVPPASIIDTEATRTGLGTAGPPKRP